MTDLFHAWALAPATIGVCCVAADRGRARWPDIAASVLMLIAMLDAVLTHLVAPVYWASAVLAGAMALAAWHRPRGASNASGRARPPIGMTLHTTTGMVAMAAFQLAMTHDASVEVAPASHAHGGTASLLAAVLLAGTLAHLALSGALLSRVHGRLDRIQLLSMGVAVGLMGIASVSQVY